MTDLDNLPRYDRRKSYDWNYDHAPDPFETAVPPYPGDWTFCGLPVGSPLGVPAGPLLNGRWCLYYASLGFDVLTYKTVRSGQRPCYDLPNLQPVDCGSLDGGESNLRAVESDRDSWAVSFGMPSKSPDVWRADVEWTRRQLARDKLLVVSVVGTQQPGWGIEELARDYARCAAWAVESGADAVEANLSCPNVSTPDGQLYYHPQAVAVVASELSRAAAGRPLILKIGHLPEGFDIASLIVAMAPAASAVAMTNSVAATVADEQGRLLFGGEKRGICGAAIRRASLEQVRRWTQTTRDLEIDLPAIGVGGAATAQDVADYLQCGAQAVHLATAAMLDPAVAMRIRREVGRP